MANTFKQYGPPLGSTLSGIKNEADTSLTANFGIDWQGHRAAIPIVTDVGSLIVPSATLLTKGKLTHVQSGHGVFAQCITSGGIALAAGKLVKLVFAAVRGIWIPQIEALANNEDDQHCYPIDCLLRGGVAQWDYCWVRTGGVARFIAGDAGVTALDRLLPAASDAGEVITHAFTAAATADEVFNMVGTALQTGTDGQLIFGLVNPRFFAY